METLNIYYRKTESFKAFDKVKINKRDQYVYVNLALNARECLVVCTPESSFNRITWRCYILLITKPNICSKPKQILFSSVPQSFTAVQKLLECYMCIHPQLKIVPINCTFVLTTVLSNLRRFYL